MTIQRVGAPIAGGGNQPNDVAVLTDGSFYVAQSANSLQHYGPDGSLIGGPVVIDYPVGPQGVYFADLVPLTGGGFAVMFINGNINAGNFDGASVRYFAADGTPSSPFITVAEPNGIRKDEFNIVAKSDGGVFVSWSDNTNSGELYNPLFAGTLDYGGGTGAGRGTDLAGRSISALGVAGPIDLADGTELATNSNHSYNGLAGDQRPGANAAFSDGTVLAPYVEINFKAVPGNIDQPNSVANEPIPSVSYRIFGAEGFSAEGRIDAGTVSFLQRPDSVVLANGNFAIVYTEDNPSSGGPRYSTQVGIVNGIDGSLLSDTVLLERASSSGLNDTRIVALSDGGFAMAYVTADAGSGGDVGLLIVNADGTVRDNSLIASGPGTQNLTDFNTSPDGTLYVSYFDSSATVGAQYATQRFVITGSGGVVKTGSDDRNDVLVGTEGQDRLSGLGGNDKLLGLGGDDQLYGGAGNDKLDGGAGADLMVGGSGNDTYTVDSLGDTIDERGDATGIDQVNSSVSFTLGTNLEKLTLTGAAAIDGSGNELANRIVGNGAANLLHGGDGNDTLAGGAGNDTLYGDAGNDKLDGGAGADAMHGGAGNDTYLVDNVGDTVDETGVGGGDAGGTDKVTLDTYAYVLSGGSSYALSAYVENLSLTGTAALDATGNDLANRITGNAGANSLVGGAGNDTLNGLAGRDILTGGDGKDTLTGGTGADTFVFGPANAASADKVTDFSSFDGDRLQFRAEDFGLSPGKGVAADGTLATDYFEVVSGKTAVGTRDHGEFLFNTSTKLLSWDADGSGKGAAIAVATFTVPAGTAIADFLKASDFHLV